MMYILDQMGEFVVRISLPFLLVVLKLWYVMLIDRGHSGSVWLKLRISERYNALDWIKSTLNRIGFWLIVA